MGRLHARVPARFLGETSGDMACGTEAARSGPNGASESPGGGRACLTSRGDETGIEFPAGSFSLEIKESREACLPFVYVFCFIQTGSLQRGLIEMGCLLPC